MVKTPHVKKEAPESKGGGSHGGRDSTQKTGGGSSGGGSGGGGGGNRSRNPKPKGGGGGNAAKTTTAPAATTSGASQAQTGKNQPIAIKNCKEADCDHKMKQFEQNGRFNGRHAKKCKHFIDTCATCNGTGGWHRHNCADQPTVEVK